LVMVAHGFLAALTFGLSGYVFQQTGTLEMNQLGGLLRKLPFIGSALVMAAFAGCGLPGFANFPGEASVLFGAWKTFRPVTILACWGALIIGALYLLRAVRVMLHGPVSQRCANITDAPHLWRKAPFILLLTCLIIFGCFPRLLSDKIRPSAEDILNVRKPVTSAESDPSSFQVAEFSNRNYPVSLRANLFMDSSRSDHFQP